MSRTVETLQVFGGLLLTMVVLFVPITIGIVLLQRWAGPERLRRWLGGRTLPGALVRGTALGALTPFCGCSTIPLLLGLLRANVRSAAVAAFTLASPLLNPYILTVVALLFGPRVAVVYAGVAIVSTLVLAALAEVAGLERALKAHVRPGGDPTAAPSAAEARHRPADLAAVAGSRGGAASTGAARSGGGDPSVGEVGCGSTSASGREDGDDGDEGVACDAGGDPAWRGPRAELRAAAREAATLLRAMAVPLLVGLAIGAFTYGAVPQGALTGLLGDSTWYALPLAAAMGLPLYLRGEAAFPIGAGLLAAGVGEGPMFAMVIAGMGASIPEVAILSGIFQRRLLLAFLGAVFAMAIVGGALIPRLS